MCFASTAIDSFITKRFLLPPGWHLDTPEASVGTSPQCPVGLAAISSHSEEAKAANFFKRSVVWFFVSSAFTFWWFHIIWSFGFIQNRFQTKWFYHPSHPRHFAGTRSPHQSDHPRSVSPWSVLHTSLAQWGRSRSLRGPYSVKWFSRGLGGSFGLHAFGFCFSFSWSSSFKNSSFLVLACQILQSEPIFWWQARVGQELLSEDFAILLELQGTKFPEALMTKYTPLSTWSLKESLWNAKAATDHTILLFFRFQTLLLPQKEWHEEFGDQLQRV